MTEFHNNGRLAKGCNDSFIVLIPKKEGCAGLKDFRPISLISSLYKIIAKVLARRMKVVMGKLIGDAQSAFIQGRNIMDGVVVLNEVIEDAKKSKVERLIVKVNFVKAYDSVDWTYLLGMLRSINFPNMWIKWIRECISTASANVIVNAVPPGPSSWNMA